MPRTSKVQQETNYLKIVKSAAELFGQRGVADVGIDEVMSAAGLTHGGFYKQFESKQELVRVSAAFAFNRSLDELETRDLDERIDAHLSSGHRDDSIGGCPLSSQCADAWRQGLAQQQGYANGYKLTLDSYTDALLRNAPGKFRTRSAARRRAMQILNEMTGAIMLARGVGLGDAKLSEEILETARKRLRKA